MYEKRLRERTRKEGNRVPETWEKNPEKKNPVWEATGREDRGVLTASTSREEGSQGHQQLIRGEAAEKG